VPRRYRRTTIRVPGVRVADHVADRDFNATAPNQLWVANIKCQRDPLGIAAAGVASRSGPLCSSRAGLLALPRPHV
jgi:hypothetical protein